MLAIAEDHVNPNLLFTGTEFGLVLLDRRRAEVDSTQRRPADNSGAAISIFRNAKTISSSATFGRGIYILDNYTPLRLIKPETLRQEAAVFPVKDALMYIQSQPLGGRGKSFQGERFYTADNPPFGATVTWYLKDAIKTRKEKRQEREREADRRGAPVGWPTRERTARGRRGRSAGDYRHDH